MGRRPRSHRHPQVGEQRVPWCGCGNFCATTNSMRPTTLRTLVVLKKGEFRQNQFRGHLWWPDPTQIRHSFSWITKAHALAKPLRSRVRYRLHWSAAAAIQTSPNCSARACSNQLHAGSKPIALRHDVLSRGFTLGQVLDPSTTRAIFCGVADPVSAMTAPCPSGTAPAADRFSREPFAGNLLPTGPPGCERDQTPELVSSSEQVRPVQ